MEDSTPAWLKRTVQIAGLFLGMGGLILAVNLLCVVPLILWNNSDYDAIIYGVSSLAITLLTLGAGGIAFWHADRALHKKVSGPLRLPSTLLLAGIFIFLLELGLISWMRLQFLFPLILVACAVLPPLWAISWMIPSAPAQPLPEGGEEGNEDASSDDLAPPHVLTWRRGLLAFTGGATISVLIALVLELLLPTIILSLVSNVADTVLNSVNALFRALTNRELAGTLTSHGFLYLFAHVAVIAPIVQELTKPLVTLPLLRSQSRQQAFLIGAVAGAGFAAVENIIYVTAGLSIWGGILLVRALGAALHPLCSGWVAIGWRDVLRGEDRASTNWWRRFGAAVAVHSAWNGGSLLVIAVAGTRFFGELPAEIDLLGLSAAGTTLAFLIVLGLLALWFGRAYGHEKPSMESEQPRSSETLFPPSDQAAAIWAVTCLAVIVPAGIAGLMLWLR